MFGMLSQASIFARISIFIGVVPLGVGIVYAIWPGEQRLALVRPLSLATIFAGISALAVGLINVLRFVSLQDSPTLNRVAAIGLAEALVPLFVGFGCLMVTWLCVAIGIWRRP